MDERLNMAGILAQSVVEDGEEVQTRDETVLELMDSTIEAPAGTIFMREGFNPYLGILEGMFIVNGWSNNSLFAPLQDEVDKKIQSFPKFDYADRIGPQLDTGALGVAKRSRVSPGSASDFRIR